MDLFNNGYTPDVIERWTDTINTHFPNLQLAWKRIKTDKYELSIGGKTLFTVSTDKERIAAMIVIEQLLGQIVANPELVKLT